MSVLRIGYDAAALKRIKSLAQFRLFLLAELEQAMGLSTDVLDTKAADWMAAYFKNDTGDLRDSLQQITYSPFEAELTTDSPYAWRREEGFSGMTDSLGRFYPDDPGIGYMANALDLAEPDIQEIFEAAIAIAILKAGGYR